MENRERIRLALVAYHLNPTEDQLQKCVADIEGLYEETKESLEARKQRFREECQRLLKEDRSNAKTLTDFFKYWSETSSRGRKMRYEKQKTFDIRLRYATWEKNQKRFSVVNLLKR